MTIVAGIVVVAAAATLGDFIWYTVGVRHTMVAGLVHGALLLTAVGGALGAASGCLAKGLPLGTLAGLGGALSYYFLIVVMDSRTYGTAIPGAWVIMWLLLATLDGRWLRAPNRRDWKEVATRGVVAAVAAGIAFALVRNVLWGRPAAEGRTTCCSLRCGRWPGLRACSRSRGQRQHRTTAPRLCDQPACTEADRRSLWLDEDGRWLAQTSPSRRRPGELAVPARRGGLQPGADAQIGSDGMTRVAPRSDRRPSYLEDRFLNRP